MNSQENYDSFAVVALFNTFLGLFNAERNTQQYEIQNLINQKLDSILGKLDTMEGGNNFDKD